jgi:prepilin-type processing-associated H-X9-DG protein
VGLSEIVDGTSNTLLFGERLHGILSVEDQSYYHWWQSGFWMDAFFDTTFPINAHRRFKTEIDVEGWWWVPFESASSFHPGGSNFAMCDGSVRFLKDTIATWQTDYNNLGDPVGIAYGDTCGEYQLGRAKPQVYQALSTRRGGETISSDSY